MRLLVLTSTWPRRPGDGRGGLVREWCRTLSRRGMEIGVVAPRPIDDPPPADPADPFRVTWLPEFLPGRSRAFHGSGLHPDVARDPAALLGLPAFLAAFAAEATPRAIVSDLVVAHGLLPMGIVGSVVSRASGKPLRIVAHSGPPSAARVPPFSLALRALTSAAESVACVSRTVEAEIRAASGPDARLVTIPLGVDLRPAVGIPSGLAVTRRVLFVGRLVHRKGVDVLVRALAGLEGVSLTVIGDGPERTSLRGMAADLGVRARFLGERDHDDARRSMAAADVLVVPSRAPWLGRADGLPRVIPEAWSCGLPVVTTSAGGAGEAVAARGAGLLALPGDAVDLRRAIRAVLENGDLRARLSCEALSAAATLSWEVVGNRWETWVRGGDPSVAHVPRNG